MTNDIPQYQTAVDGWGRRYAVASGGMGVYTGHVHDWRLASPNGEWLWYCTGCRLIEPWASWEDHEDAPEDAPEEPRYEYAVMGDDDGGDRRLSSPDHITREAVEPIATFTRSNRPRIRNVRIVRRVVGDWEDVPDGE